MHGRITDRRRYPVPVCRFEPDLSPWVVAAWAPAAGDVVDAACALGRFGRAVHEAPPVDVARLEHAAVWSMGISPAVPCPDPLRDLSARLAIWHPATPILTAGRPSMGGLVQSHRVLWAGQRQAGKPRSTELPSAALPRDTDLDAVIRDLRLDQAPIDPTTLSGEQMVAEVQRVVKALLGYGARLPKELMLYVKNMVFVDGAIARLAPDLDILAEIANISMLFAERHGERLGRELGIDPTAVEFDMTGVKAQLGLEADVDQLTYKDLQARRDLIQKRMREHIGR